MNNAGDGADCVWHLMGNHVLAERMFRHDALEVEVPSALLQS